MRKYICIFLALQILGTCLPKGQGLQAIFRIGAFVHHYAEHHDHHQESIGLLEFIKLHYSGHEHKNQDHSEHENLPFQHTHNQQQLLSQVVFVMPFQPIQLAFKKQISLSSSPIIHLQQWSSSLHSLDIWQPPRA